MLPPANVSQSRVASWWGRAGVPLANRALPSANIRSASSAVTVVDAAAAAWASGWVTGATAGLTAVGPVVGCGWDSSAARKAGAAKNNGADAASAVHHPIRVRLVPD
jgi:hypothetical protein